MDAYTIIDKKKNALSLTKDEIQFMDEGYTSGTIPDYQMSAFLMAVYFNGMDTSELSFLTTSMLHSGETYDLSGISGIKVDKHSTGGVGDGTSLVLAPLAASCGIVVPMMSGRALGHTGGTLDKLESIPGFNVCLTAQEFYKQLRTLGVAMIGQSEHIAPADRKMYALRDVTATVNSIPLIAASIMSKKLAEGSDALVLDIKVGSGAFMRHKKEAYTLAHAMIAIGKSHHRTVRALITDMNQPLGNAVGNVLEIRQALDVLQGKGPQDFVNLIIALGSRMLVMGKKASTLREAQRIVQRKLSSGAAYEVFVKLVKMQRGDVRVTDNPEKYLPQAKHRTSIHAFCSGKICSIDTTAVGMASVLLGAGRSTKKDVIDHGAGIYIHKKIGDTVNKKEPLATLYYSKKNNVLAAQSLMHNAYRIGKKPQKRPLIYKDIV